MCKRGSHSAVLNLRPGHVVRQIHEQLVRHSPPGKKVGHFVMPLFYLACPAQMDNIRMETIEFYRAPWNYISFTLFLTCTAFFTYFYSHGKIPLCRQKSYHLRNFSFAANIIPPCSTIPLFLCRHTSLYRPLSLCCLPYATNINYVAFSIMLPLLSPSNI